MGGCEVDDGSGMLLPLPFFFFFPVLPFSISNKENPCSASLSYTFLQNFLHAGDHVHLGPGVTGTRLTNPAVDLHDLPRIDLICLSHYHACVTSFPFTFSSRYTGLIMPDGLLLSVVKPVASEFVDGTHAKSTR